ncbi:MAG: diadenylate cyclase CdaA [Anaerolineaceae bacterium]|jgi:diadenylate cyclase
MTDLWSEIVYIFQRMNWLSILDVFLVAAVVFAVLLLLRDTQIMILLRGVIVIIVLLVLLTTLINLPGFTWLVNTIVPALMFAIPVIFAPEIRRGLEKLGRAGSSQLLVRQTDTQVQLMEKTIHAIVTAASRLSAREHGALIVMQRSDSLEEYSRTGVRMNAEVTPELLLQIFYPNTPLHDGAVIVSNNRIIAGSCVMPLSSSGILTRSPERQMGLRHRAALGTSEATDAITVVVSEETGSISIAHNGRMIRRLDSERLENILLAFYQPAEISMFKLKPLDWLKKILTVPRREE